MAKEVIFHTDKTLREHGLLVKHEIGKLKDKFTVVDWQTYKPASQARVKAWEAAQE